jgi:5-methylcytosine-specific restriction endonuclease McrA
MGLATRCLDCKIRTTDGSRCSRCYQLRRGSTAERGYGSAHQRRARQAIAAQPWCTECGRTTDLTADHVLPLALGGHPLGELRVLCRSCNSRRGANSVS